MTELFDRIPLPLLFASTLTLIYLSIEAGIRLGVVHQQVKAAVEPSVTTMAGATAGLLAFMLAVTYGAAAARHDTRKHLVIQEASAIEVAYLRAGLLPEPGRSRARMLLADYVQVRVVAGRRDAGLEQALRRSEELQHELWLQVEAGGQQDSHSITLGLFAEAVNGLIDIYLERLGVSFRQRIPWTSWAALYVLAVLTMFQFGYRSGLGASRSHVASAALALSFSMVLYLVADLDHPRQGLVTVSQQAMVDLQQRIQTGQ